MPINNWATAPFDLIVHGEEHLRLGEDFDRRIALISLDNAIEVSIVNYLTMNPAFRNGKSYERAKKDAWLKNYPSKLQFLDEELQQRGLPWVVTKEDVLWVHEQRNEQYHGKDGGIPSLSVLATARAAAAWVFAELFAVSNIETEIDDAIHHKKKSRASSRLRVPRFDRAIDNVLGVIEFGEQAYLASDILFHVDPDAYRAVGLAYAGDESP
jgi:hypothetical protein